MAETEVSKETPKKRKKKSNGAAAPEAEVCNKDSAAVADASSTATPDPEVVNKLIEVRAQVREGFGKTVMAMMALPRYRHLPVGELPNFVLEPLIRDRIAMAYPADEDKAALNDVSGMAIWASVSEEVDAKIQDQIKGGVFPLRLAPDDWQSGEINWLLDVIAADKATTLKVISNFGQVVKGGALKIHPLVTRLVDREVLEKMGAERLGEVSDKGAE